MDQKPSKRRFVSFFNAEGVDNAAMIVAVQSDTCVSLVVWDEQGVQHFESSCVQGTGPGQWSWPQRV